MSIHFYLCILAAAIHSCSYATANVFSTYDTMNNNNGRRSYYPTASVVNVNDFIHQTDSDHTQAFEKAWSKACETENALLVVPRSRTPYRVKQLTFSGPCVSPITVQIYGTIEASNDMSDYENDRIHWIVFKSLHDLTVTGGGTIDGNGAIWWKNSCKIDNSLPCSHAPTAMTFEDCKNLQVSKMTYRNAQQMHLIFDNCLNVRASNLVVSSPGDSPNTDGIHVTGSKNVVIERSVIGTGDDCISIVSGSTNVNATDIICGPGHGISIGSLGKDGSEATVSNVFVNRATLTGTTNGLRIKSWQGGSGYADSITFQNVVLHNVSNPIIIDQNYCDQPKSCPQKNSAVQVRNVRYNNIRGTSQTDVAIDFDCSRSIPCKKIVLQDVHLDLQDGEGDAKAACKNILLTRVGHVYPHC